MQLSKSPLEEKKVQTPSPAATNFHSTSSMAPPAMFSSTQNMAVNQNLSKPAQEQQQQQAETEQNQTAEVAEETGVGTNLSPNDMLDAVIDGHQVFKSSARFTNVQIQGPSAIGAPGCLSAPNVSGLIYGNLAGKAKDQEDLAMAKAVGNVMGQHLLQWASSLIVPGLPWYPSFSFFPAPTAPPMPNVPTPLQSCPSFSEYLLTNQEMITNQIMSKLPSEMKNDVNRGKVASFSSMASGYFVIWLQSTFLYNVLGMGTVPTFAPPFVLGGPVVGKVIPTSGVLN
ncbi:hypothetical protein [Portibacter marinus]|uniref:hypothetical protein n=1 Tax=Portibacter marinus TaxID=2898660 RepID=UPI001F36E251|nr:hypothetical protein [Portibacter marinus]